MKTRIITAPDNINLFVRNWDLPPFDERAGSILIIHGLGEHSGRYEKLAKIFNNLGLDVRSYDQRGHGKSSGKKGTIPYKDSLLDDAKLVYDDFAKGRPQKPFILGHNLGGILATALTIKKILNPRGIILAAPVFRPFLSTLQKTQIILGNVFFPQMALPNEFSLEYLSHDKKIVEDYQTDPLKHNKVSPRMAKFIVEAGKECVASAENWQTPTLILVPENDYLVDSKGSEMFYQNAPKDIVKMRVYKNLYHEVFNELGEESEKVYADVQEWLIEQIST
jgi:alpha-beta hydrolase superfamily lysophospholipase